MTSIQRYLRKADKKIIRLTGLLRNRSLILLYHRIANFKPDPQLLCVSPEHFREHLEHIKRHYRPLSLQALRKALINGTIPHKGVVVTFDDGYVDNLWNAKPLLEKYEVPASVFVTSGFVGKDRELTSDVLERCLLQPKQLPDVLNLKINGKECSWIIDGYRADAEGWNVTMDVNPTHRHRCYRELHSVLRPMNDGQRQHILNELSQWASTPVKARSDRRIVNEEEIRKLQEGGLIEIGSHGTCHLLLEVQPPEQQREDVITSKHALETILGKNVNLFAYPYGGHDAVGTITKNCVKEAGFDLACDSVRGTARCGGDVYALPRLLVRDWNGEVFYQHLRKAFME